MLEKLVADEAPDLICLQETKLQESHVKDWEAKLDGYSSHWSCSTKKKGYAADVGNYISGHMVVSVPIIEHEVMTYGFAAVGDITPVKAAEQDLVADMKAVIDNLDRH